MILMMVSEALTLMLICVETQNIDNEDEDDDDNN